MKPLRRVAAFFYSEKPKPGFVQIPVGPDLVGYVKGILTPNETTLVGALDWVHRQDGSSQYQNYPDDTCFMNGHFISERLNTAHEILSAALNEDK